MKFLSMNPGIDRLTGGPDGETGFGGGGAGAGGGGGGGAALSATSTSDACPARTVSSRSSAKNPSFSNRSRYDPTASCSVVVPSEPVVACDFAVPDTLIVTSPSGVPL